jgi:hypothetical protein
MSSSLPLSTYSHPVEVDATTADSANAESSDVVHLNLEVIPEDKQKHNNEEFENKHQPEPDSDEEELSMIAETPGHTRSDSSNSAEMSLSDNTPNEHRTSGVNTNLLLNGRNTAAHNQKTNSKCRDKCCNSDFSVRTSLKFSICVNLILFICLVFVAAKLYRVSAEPQLFELPYSDLSEVSFYNSLRSDTNANTHVFNLLKASRRNGQYVYITAERFSDRMNVALKFDRNTYVQVFEYGSEYLTHSNSGSGNDSSIYFDDVLLHRRLLISPIPVNDSGVFYDHDLLTDMDYKKELESSAICRALVCKARFELYNIDLITSVL